MRADCRGLGALVAGGMTFAHCARRHLLGGFERKPLRGLVKRIIVIIALLSLAVPAQASATLTTTTTGRVCCPHFAGKLESGGAYKFKGTTKPSLKGQYVYFQYKRPGATHWHPFKVGLGGSDGNGFYLLKKNRPRDAINDRHRWNSNWFTPSVFPAGYWKLRALFPKQGNYARSAVVKKYWVSAGD